MYCYDIRELDDGTPEILAEELLPLDSTLYDLGAGPQQLTSHEDVLARIYAQDSQVREQVPGAVVPCIYRDAGSEHHAP
jgi:hypothetical protein